MLAQRHEAPLNGRFTRCGGTTGDDSRSRRRMDQHIIEDHRAALKFGQQQKRLKPLRRYSSPAWSLPRVLRRATTYPRPRPKEVEARMWGDAKNPASRLSHFGAFGSCA